MSFLKLVQTTDGSGWLFNQLTGQVCGPDGRAAFQPGDWWEFPTCASPRAAGEMATLVKSALAQYPEFKMSMKCTDAGNGSPAIEIAIVNDASEGDPAYRNERFNAGALLLLWGTRGADAVKAEIKSRLGYQ